MHDANGHPLKVGDRVLIPCVVTNLSEGSEDFCNVSVKTTIGRRPDGARESFSAINTGVLVKVAGDGVSLNL
jgi:hypothetical protein